MREITQEELNTILKRHLHWLKEDCEGWENMRADLRDTDLRGLDLKHSYLKGAILSHADLSGVNLRCSSLSGADLFNAYLREANLSSVDLSGADLSWADLSGADLSGADLSEADLIGTNLKQANLFGAKLRFTNLTNVKYDERTSFFSIQCPEEGSFIGYKKAGGYIVKLLITEDSLRSSATTRKCRCSKAKVLDILNFDRTKARATEVASDYDKNFIYKIGEIVEVSDFNKDRWEECTSSIHFFITFEEAVNYR